jgi:ABC-type transport system involved in cytochrome bd biosynthesis fused ATPase/permease subunit
MSRTIRENIVGDLDFDKDWFDITLSLCELETDLAALEARDLHCAGDKGMSLSGGQRQRIVSGFCVLESVLGVYNNLKDRLWLVPCIRGSRSLC